MRRKTVVLLCASGAACTVPTPGYGVSSTSDSTGVSDAGTLDVGDDEGGSGDENADAENTDDSAGDGDGDTGNGDGTTGDGDGMTGDGSTGDGDGSTGDGDGSSGDGDGSSGDGDGTAGDGDGDGTPGCGNGTQAPGDVCFGPPISFPIAPGAMPRYLAAGLIDGDGAIDIALTDEVDASMRVMIGDGGGSLALGGSYGTPAVPSGLALGDLDSDGRPEALLGRSIDANSAGVLWNDGAGAFPTQTDFTVGVDITAVAILDVEGDTSLDLLAASSGDDTLYAKRGTGAGGFGPGWSGYWAPLAPSHMKIGSFVGDPETDVLAGSRTTNVFHVIEGTGNSGYFPADDQIATGGGTLSDLVGGDFDGDGPIDVVTTDDTADAAFFSKSDGAGGFSAPVAVVSFPASPGFMTVADLDLDGDLDLAVTYPQADTVSIVIGDGAGGFAIERTVSVGGTPSQIVAADMNGDTVPDLVFAERTGGAVGLILSDP